MQPDALIPTPEAIPVAWGWLEGLNILTFYLHILMVNLLLGGGAIVLYLHVKNKERHLVSSAMHKLPAVFALVVNLGVAPLLFLQVVYGHFFYTSSILSAFWWLGIIDLLILGYGSLYINQNRRKKSEWDSGFFLALGLVFSLCVALVLVNVISMMIRPEAWTAYVGNVGTAFNGWDVTYLPRLLHYLFASVAVGGLVLGLWAGRAGVEDAAGTRTVARNAFVWGTALQMLAGLWWLMALDRPVMLGFMGGNGLATALLAVGLILAVAALLAGWADKLGLAAGLTGGTVAVMVCVRAMLRGLTLDPWFAPGDLAVTGEVSPMILFLVSLVAGVAVIAYMLKLGFRAKREG